MNHKCALCGADQVWDQETQKYSCSDKCHKIAVADDYGLPKSFKKQYRFLIQTVRKMHRDVSVLKAMNREGFDAYLNSLGGNTGDQDGKES